MIAAHGGLEIGRSDDFLVGFPDAAAALAFAAGYRELLPRRTPAGAPPLQARVGAHHGPVQLRVNDPADRARGAAAYCSGEEVDGWDRAVDHGKSWLHEARTRPSLVTRAGPTSLDGWRTAATATIPSATGAPAPAEVWPAMRCGRTIRLRVGPSPHP